MTERWHPEQGVLLDIALGDGGADGRAAAHLADCATCRRAYDELLAGIDLTLAAVPRAAAPPGFESTVLDALGAGAVARPRRARWLSVAAAALLGVAVGFGAAHLATDEAPPAAGAEPFQDEDGVTVGTVMRADGPGGGRLVVVLDARLPATGLTCRVVLEDGTVRDLAHWMPGYSEVWVLAEPAPGVRTVELVAESGETWARAEL